MSNSYGATHIFASTGTVYLGTYNSTSVAIKRFEKKKATDAVSIDDFIAEFEAIVDLRHQNLVQFFGVVLEPTTLQHSIVTELMRKGKPWFFTNLSTGKGVEEVTQFLESQIPSKEKKNNN